MLSYDRDLKDRARKMRKNMTPAEKLLWVHLRGKKLDEKQWYRQKPIGDYIVDFYCPSRKLVVEADGFHHFSKDGLEYDSSRDGFLEEEGLKVLHFSNREILRNTDHVLERILMG